MYRLSDLRRSPAFPIHTRRRRPTRAIGLIAAVVLMAALLAPLAQPAAAVAEPTEADAALARQDGAEATATDEVIQSDSGEEGGIDATPDVETPVPEETPIAEETPNAEETPTSEETPDGGFIADQGDPKTSVIGIKIFECGSDYGADLQRLIASCWAAGDIALDVYGGGVLQESAVGEFAAGDLPAGVYTIREHIPTGYRQPLAFCGIGPANQEAEFVQVVTYDGYYEFTLGADQTIVCYYFHVLQGNVSVRIDPFYCPADFDATSTDIYDFTETCFKEITGAGFHVFVPGGIAIRSGYASGSPNIVKWTDLPAIGLEIGGGNDVGGYGQPVVFCGLTDAGGNMTTHQRVTLQQYFQGGPYYFTLTFNPGDTLNCNWYYIPAETDPGIGNGRLTIYPYVCQADATIDYYTADESVLGERCPALSYDAIYDEVWDYTSFDLYSHTSGRTETKWVDDGGGSAVSAHWGKVPTGTVDVTGQRWEGYGDPIVFCGVAYPTGVIFFDVEVEDWRTSFVIPPDQTVLCFWYNIPAPGKGDVYITKHDCPADIDAYTADLFTLGDTCPGMEGVEFIIGDSEGNHLVSGRTEGDLGEIAFEDLPSGKISIIEPVLNGYGAPVVFCRVGVAGGQQSDYELVPVNYGDGAYVVNKTLYSGEFIACEWFNIPEKPGTVIIFKYFCPEEVAGEPVPADPSDLADDCEPYKGDDVTFDLYHAGTGKTETRSPNEIKTGAATWDPVPPGDLTITEHEVDGYGAPIVYCGPGRPEDVPDYQRYEVDGRSIDVRLESGVTLFCVWFNIPAEHGSVTVIKYTCPAGDGYRHGDFDWFSETCDEPAEGVTFKLDGDRSGTPGDQTTDADGMVYWGDREADRYSLSEDLPAGYGKPVIFCDSYYPFDEQPPDWDEYDPERTPDADPFDYRIEFGLSEGQHIICYWFNVPYDDDDPGTITIVKYWCDSRHISDVTCDLYRGGQDFLLRPVNGDKAIRLTTGQSGAASVSVAPGQWTIEEVGYSWCKATSPDVNAAGRIVARAGHDAIVTIYNCDDGTPGTPNPPGKGPVKELPGTGTGDAAGTSRYSDWTGVAGTVALLLAASALLGTAGVIARRPWAVSGSAS